MDEKHQRSPENPYRHRFAFLSVLSKELYQFAKLEGMNIEFDFVIPLNNFDHFRTMRGFTRVKSRTNVQHVTEILLMIKLTIGTEKCVF